MYDYHLIEDNLLKFDALGHGAPTTLKNLKELSGIDYKKVDYTDPILFKSMYDITNLEEDPVLKNNLKQNAPFKTGCNGLPELSTSFLSQMISALKPETFNEIKIIQGLSHGSGIWIGSQAEPFKAGLITKDDIFACREEVTKLLVKGGLEESVAFGLVEKLRKGKPLTNEEIKIIYSTNLKKIVKENILKISYLFPEAEHCVHFINNKIKKEMEKIESL